MLWSPSQPHPVLLEAAAGMRVGAEGLLVPLKSYSSRSPCGTMQQAKLTEGSGCTDLKPAGRDTVGICVCVCRGHGNWAKHCGVHSSCETQTIKTTERLTEQADQYGSPLLSSSLGFPLLIRRSLLLSAPFCHL